MEPPKELRYERPRFEYLVPAGMKLPRDAAHLSFADRPTCPPPKLAEEEERPRRSSRSFAPELPPWEADHELRTPLREQSWSQAGDADFWESWPIARR